MVIIYRFSIWLYLLVIRLLAPYHAKAKAFIQGRKGLLNSLKQYLEPHPGTVIWMHVASYGEFEQARTIIEDIKDRRSDIKMLLTFFSPSGYEACKDYQQADYAYYLPIDSPGNADKFIRIVNPAVAIFIKYEFWYFFLRALRKAGIPTLVVSAVFRENQWFFHPTGRFMRKELAAINWFFVQDQRSCVLLRKFGIRQYTLAGDTRFDRVNELADHPEEIPKLSKFKGERTLMALGSVWPSDLKKLLPFITGSAKEICFLIAPHELDPIFLDQLDQLPDSVRYTEFDVTPKNSQLLILDTIGQLASAYQYADYAYVGGGFRGGLHNLLEPAAYGIPVFFGEHTSNSKFIEAVELVKAGGAFSFYDLKKFQDTFDQLRSDKDLYRKVSKASKDFVRSRSGATPKVTEKILELL